MILRKSSLIGEVDITRYPNRAVTSRDGYCMGRSEGTDSPSRPSTQSSEWSFKGGGRCEADISYPRVQGDT